MFYIDTSVLAAYYCPEPLSEKAESFLTNHPRPAISALTELELFSSISRKIREKELDRQDGEKIILKFLSHLDSHFFSRFSIEEIHYRLARDWIGQFKTALRSFDAIHLALSSSVDATVVTADESLAKSAEYLSIDVLLLSQS